MNRAHHIKRTLLKNIKAIKDSKIDSEIILLDYDSKDDLELWTKISLSDFLENEIIKYYKVHSKEFFYPSKAKNIAHRLSSGKIVCNIDADNLFTKDLPLFIQSEYEKNNNIVGKVDSGLNQGLIFMSKENFVKLNGYDESFSYTGYGHEDTDLIARAERMGLEKILISTDMYSYINHSNEERVSNFNGEDNFGEYAQVNKKKEEYNTRNNITTVDQVFGVDDVYRLVMTKDYDNYRRDEFAKIRRERKNEFKEKEVTKNFNRL